MTLLQQLFSDPRHKRLLPVVAVLVAALVAIPVLLMKSGASPAGTASAPAAGAAAPPATAVPAVSINPALTHAQLNGTARDPFTQQQLASTAAAGASTSATAPVGQVSATTRASVSGATTPSTSSGAGTSSAGATSGGESGASGDATNPITYFHYAVDFSFGKVGSAAHKYSDAQRLQPLPSAKNPVVVFLGLKKDAKTAVFLVSSTASPAGDGKCLPSRRNCTFLQLTRGQHDAVLAQNGDGSVTEYDLTLTRVRLVQSSQPPSGAAGNGNVSHAGSQILSHAKQLLPVLRSLAYSTSTGLLSFDPASASGLVHLGLLPPEAGAVLEPVGSNHS